MQRALYSGEPYQLSDVQGNSRTPAEVEGGRGRGNIAAPPLGFFCADAICF